MIFTVSAIDPNPLTNAAQVVQLRDFEDSTYTSLSRFIYHEGNALSNQVVEIGNTEGLFTIIGY